MTMRELSTFEAKAIINCFSKAVKTQKNRAQIEARDRLIGFLLLMLGIRASELIRLNWGSFHRNNRGDSLVDVLEKGGKERTLSLLWMKQICFI
jgi:integrase/recombinase XerD